MLDDLDYRLFIRAVQRLTGVDLALYRQTQMQRRLRALLHRVGARSFAEYAAMLERDPARLQEFRDYLTINVTEFFRDPERFRFLETRVLPELLAARPGLRVWSAACSIGCEPYSVAILLKELAPRGAHHILATDIDTTIVARARQGEGYSHADLRGVTPARLSRAFVPRSGGTWAIRPEYREMVEFRVHNLLGPPPGRGFDLILCRNVVIYFTDEAKALLYRGLVSALRPGGYLFVGGTEIVNQPSRLGLEAVTHSFYRQRVAAAGGRLAAAR